MKPYDKSCTDLTSLQPAEFRQWLDSFDTVLTDCDGVLWNGYRAIDGAAEALNTLRSLGKRVIFVTNNSVLTRPQLLKKASGFGHEVQEADLITSASAAAAYLKQRNFTQTAYVIGMPSIGTELDAVGIRHIGIGPDTLDVSLGELVNERFQPHPDIGAVIVGFDEHFSFPKMFKAATYLDQPGCLFLGTNRDERVRMANGHLRPEAGPMIRSVEVTAGRQCVLVGKPEPSVCEALLAQNGGPVRPERTLMVGDRCDTDVMLGVNCGFGSTLMVGTGVHSLADVERFRGEDGGRAVPDFYAESLGKVAELLK